MRKLAPAFLLLTMVACSGPQQRPGNRIEAELDGAGMVMLWCANRDGQRCATAADALGVVPQRTEVLPQRLFGPMVDGEDDCVDPGTAIVLGVVARALGLDAGNWHDNIGGRLGRDDIDKTFVGGGCTNCCWDKSEPPVKVHAIDDQDGRLYLVRVWEQAQ